MKPCNHFSCHIRTEYSYFKIKRRVCILYTHIYNVQSRFYRMTTVLTKPLYTPRHAQNLKQFRPHKNGFRTSRKRILSQVLVSRLRAQVLTGF